MLWFPGASSCKYVKSMETCTEHYSVMHCNTEVSSLNKLEFAEYLNRKQARGSSFPKDSPKFALWKSNLGGVLKWNLQSRNFFHSLSPLSVLSLFLGTLSHKCSATENVSIFADFLLFWRGDKRVGKKTGRPVKMKQWAFSDFPFYLTAQILSHFSGEWRK